MDLAISRLTIAVGLKRGYAVKRKQIHSRGKM
jgi:hypothetical protein